jgi:hypothetical protein
MKQPPKYAVYPGEVESKSDGQLHYITAGELCMLYGVRRDECVIVMPRYYSHPYYKAFLERASKLIALRPRYDGNYTLPTA